MGRLGRDSCSGTKILLESESEPSSSSPELLRAEIGAEFVALCRPGVLSGDRSVVEGPLKEWRSEPMRTRDLNRMVRCLGGEVGEEGSEEWAVSRRDAVSEGKMIGMRGGT